jgi:nucleoside-diphosphate-sugar epimerase
MVFHLAQQMKAGKRPRIFKHGEQKRDFVYVKDAVEGSIRGLDAETSGIYNLGTGQARSFNELIEVLNKCLSTNFQPEYFDNPALALSKLHASRSHQRAESPWLRAALFARRRRARLHAVAVWAKIASPVILSEAQRSRRIPRPDIKLTQRDSSTSLGMTCATLARKI